MNQVKVTERVQKQLFELQDLQYRDFQAKLLPTIEKETVIGVRMLFIIMSWKKFINY